ncbi:MAG: universal stress protein [Brevibacterium sp.]|uniref:universal stress protein n=1 Tax=Brevibacterium sp. GP-SGM9 TaxID=3376990 RepID=UPI0039A52EED
MTDFYSTPRKRFPVPSLRVSASEGIDDAARTVVLAYREDSSPAVLEQAVAAARRENAGLRAIVFGTDTTTGPVTSAASACTRLAEELAETGLDYEVQRAGDDLADQIIDLAEDHSAELIVMATRRRSPVVKLLVGSTAQRVLLEAECPVLIVK